MPHIHPLIDFTVGAFIVHNDKVALIHHRELKKWLAVGGHIELDEDPDEALFPTPIVMLSLSTSSFLRQIN